MSPTEGAHGVQVFDDAESVARAAAEEFVRASAEAVGERGAFSVALSGGTTPRRVYELLASDEYRERAEWPNAHVFFCDERTVPPDHADSTYRMARAALLSRVNVPAENVHRIEGVGDAAANASDYESVMRGFFGDSAWPRFDLVFLGMGDDGHTASLFPETSALGEARAWAAANWVEKLGAWRITLTAPAINAARRVLFLVTGASKAERLDEVINGAQDPARLPSQMIRPRDGTLRWYVDRAAASKLN